MQGKNIDYLDALKGIGIIGVTMVHTGGWQLPGIYGVTNIALGIIAEYLWRTYDAARKRPVFLVSEVLKIRETADE